MKSMIDKAVEDLSAQFVEKLSALSVEPYFRTAIMQMALREVAWGLLHADMGAQHEIADHLRGMGDVIDEHKDDSR